LKPPTIRSIGTFYAFEWADAQIAATVERSHQHSDGRVTAEVTFRTTVQGMPPHLHQAQLNLLATNTKKTLAKHLESVFPLSGGWEQVIEQVCVLTIQKMREGEPIKRLGGSVSLPALTWMLEPLLPEQDPAMLYADGGSLKSYLALFFGILIQRNVQHLKLKPKQGNVLYLDWETNWEAQERRMLLLQEGLGLVPKADMLYRRCYTPLADDIVQLQKFALEHNVGYIIVDSLSGACGSDLEKQETAAKFFGSLASLKVGALVITHVAKQNTGPFGSAYWRNYTRSAFEMRTRMEAQSSRADVALFHRKMNDGPMLAPRGFEFLFSPTSTVVQTFDVRDVPELIQDATHMQRITRAVKEHGPGTVATLTAAIQEDGGQISANVVKTYLNRGLEKGIFVRLSGENWGLAGAERES